MLNRPFLEICLETFSHEIKLSHLPNEHKIPNAIARA